MIKLLLALVLLPLLCGAGLLALWFTFGPSADGVHLVINGDEMHLAQLHGWHAAAGGMALLFALCVAALAILLMLMLGLLLPLLLVLGAGLLALAAVMGAGVLTFSPLLLLVLLVWWLSRRSSRRATPPAAARTATPPPIEP